MDAKNRQSRLDELIALRNTDPDQIAQEYRRAMLGLGSLPPAPYVSFTKMIDAIVDFEEKQANLSDHGH